MLAFLGCECTGVGAMNDICNPATGQCQCTANYAARQCEECRDGFFSYPNCEGIHTLTHSYKKTNC